MHRRTGFGVATIPRADILQRFAAGQKPDNIWYGCVERAGRGLDLESS
jgi:hypothetical protein